MFVVTGKWHNITIPGTLKATKALQYIKIIILLPSNVRFLLLFWHIINKLQNRYTLTFVLTFRQQYDNCIRISNCCQGDSNQVPPRYNKSVYIEMYRCPVSELH